MTLKGKQRNTSDIQRRKQPPPKIQAVICGKILCTQLRTRMRIPAAPILEVARRGSCEGADAFVLALVSPDYFPDLGVGRGSASLSLLHFPSVVSSSPARGLALSLHPPASLLQAWPLQGCDNSCLRPFSGLHGSSGLPHTLCSNHTERLVFPIQLHRLIHLLETYPILPSGYASIPSVRAGTLLLEPPGSGLVHSRCSIKVRGGPAHSG